MPSEEIDLVKPSGGEYELGMEILSSLLLLKNYLMLFVVIIFKNINYIFYESHIFYDSILLFNNYHLF